MEDFTVDTNGQCFLCLDPVSANKIQTKSGGSRSVSPLLHSLKCVSQYLKMDLKKVFNEEGSIPPHLLAKVEKSKLKVELCERCVSINATFLKLFRQLEKIEMEVSCCLETMLRQLLKETKGGKSNRHLSLPDNDSKMSGWDGKLRVAEVLRTEAKEKCSNKLSCINFAPKLKIQNLTMRQVNETKAISKARSRTEHVDHVSLDHLAHSERKVSHEKLERPDLNIPNLMEMDDNSDYGDYNDDPIGTEDDNHSTENDQQNMQSHTAIDGAFSKASARSTPKIEAKMLSTVNPETGRLKCNLCSKEFSTRTGFCSHYKAIHLKVAYRCGTCGKNFTTKSDYLRHNQSAHLGIRFKCRFCDVVFTQKNNLTAHQKANRCKRN